jgi:hypothetical protein
VNSNQLLILNLEEVRRTSMKVWYGIPPHHNNWKPDAEAMTCIELVRHVLEGEYLYMTMLKSGGSPPSEESPCVFRTKSATHSDNKSATHSGLSGHLLEPETRRC